jgi:hypothetical protein
MIETLGTIASHPFTPLGLLGIMPWGKPVNELSVLNFNLGHWNLFGICILVLGVFIIFIKQGNFRINQIFV